MKDTKRMQEERSIFNDILKSFFDKEFIPPTLKPNLRNETGKLLIFLLGKISTAKQKIQFL